MGAAFSMRRLLQLVYRHFGPSAANVAVRPALPWYWKLIGIGSLIATGFMLGYWRYAGGDTGQLRDRIARLEKDNRSLHSQAIHVERQQQVTSVAQTDLAKDLAVLQEENVRLKEDLTFYKSILEESTGVSVVKIHSFKASKDEKAGDYSYRLLLIQSGKHDKNVQGSLQLAVIGTEDGKSVTQVVLGGKSSQQGGKINFKYYQPLEGKFRVPDRIQVQSVEAKFFQAGSTEPKLSQVVTLNR